MSAVRRSESGEAGSVCDAVAADPCHVGAAFILAGFGAAVVIFHVAIITLFVGIHSIVTANILLAHIGAGIVIYGVTVITLFGGIGHAVAASGTFFQCIVPGGCRRTDATAYPGGFSIRNGVRFAFTSIAMAARRIFAGITLLHKSAMVRCLLHSIPALGEFATETVITHFCLVRPVVVIVVTIIAYVTVFIGPDDTVSTQNTGVLPQSTRKSRMVTRIQRLSGAFKIP